MKYQKVAFWEIWGSNRWNNIVYKSKGTSENIKLLLFKTNNSFINYSISQDLL